MKNAKKANGEAKQNKIDEGNTSRCENENRHNKENTNWGNSENGKSEQMNRNYWYRHHQQNIREGRISDIKDTIEKIDSLIKKY